MTWAPEYPCISADPPWNEQGGGKIKRGADKHYGLIKKREDILRVMVTAPCWRPAANAHLWLWVTNNFLPDGLWLMDALGFRYVTNRAWGKCDYVDCPDACSGDCGRCGWPEIRDGKPEVWRPQRYGLGQYIRGAHELLLFGVRGRLPARWKDDKTLKAPPTLLLAPRTEHSSKPDQAYVDIAHVSPGPYLEMFARLPPGGRHGWDLWGNEVVGHDAATCNCVDCRTTRGGEPI